MPKCNLDNYSMDEIQAMINGGKSYAQIQRETGISQATLKKYFGPSPHPGARRSRHAYDIEPRIAKKEESTACLCVQNKSIELHGVFGVYVVDCKNENIMVSLAKSEEEEEIFSVTFEQLDNMIGELQAIQRKTKELTINNEMW